MLIECHMYSVGNESFDDIIKAMDQAGVDKTIIFASYPTLYGRRSG